MRAEHVLEKLCNVIDHRGHVTLDYLKCLAGKDSCSLYEHYGWNDLSSAYIKSDSDNKLYYIVLPGVKKT